MVKSTAQQVNQRPVPIHHHQQQRELAKQQAAIKCTSISFL